MSIRDQKVKFALMILLGVLLTAALFWGANQLRPAAVVAAPQTSGLLTTDALAGINCTIADIGIFPNRAHIRCLNGAGTVFYFAAPNDTASKAQTNQWLMLANTAYALNQNIGIEYDTDSTHNPPGCLVSDCRAIVWLVMTKP